MNVLAFDAVKRIDPTGTGDIRQRFRAEMNRRWLSLRRLTTEGITGTEALMGGGPVTVSSISASIDPLGNFQAWFDAALLRVVVGNGSWTAPFLEEAAARARSRAHRLLALRPASSEAPAPGIAPAGNSGALVSTGAVVELQGIAEAVSQRVVREVQAGLLSQRKPRNIAFAASQVIFIVGVARGKMLVEFSVNQAFNNASLDAFEAHGLTRVGIEPEHEFTEVGRDSAALDAKKGKSPSRSTLYRIAKASAKLDKLKVVEVATAGDSRVCEKCENIAEDGPYTINQARGIIPAHPRCRCAFVPYFDKG